MKSYAEINARIKSGKAVVLTADDFVAMAENEGIASAAREVDVVTTGTFAPMCSSGVFLNFGHARPRIRMSKAWLNGVPAYAGIAAVDAYLGATELPEDDPANSSYPGDFKYGGGHVIEDLVARRPVILKATSYGTDCYPNRGVEATITLDDINEAFMFNPRNCYQNYNCAVNLSDRTIYTYMGMLKPDLGNAHYSTSGELSPLLKDPFFRTIGLGTRIFLGGGTGYVAWHGTQHFPGIQKDAGGNSLGPAGGTLALIGDLKQMSGAYVRGVSMAGYGTSLSLGIGIPIPILDEEIARHAAASDSQLFAPVVDYSDAYPNRTGGCLGMVSYAQLKTGKIIVNGREVSAAPMSSWHKAREIAHTLKKWIMDGNFLLTEPVQTLPTPDDGITARTLG